MHSNTKETINYLVLDLKKEYRGALPYTDKVKYAIVSDLSEEELASVEVLNKYRPYVVITTAMYNVIRESNQNDEREHKRAYRYHDAFAIDDERAPEAIDSDQARQFPQSFQESP